MSKDRYKGELRTPSEEGGPTGKNYLLAIAIDAYVHCPKLSNCVKDAKALVGVLSSQYQFAPENILTLFNEEATRPNIHSKLKELKQQVKPNDNLVIFYSGHGEVVDDVGYWVPVGAHPEKEWEFFSTDEIRNRLNAINSFHTFVIVDACFSGSLFATYKSVIAGYETKRSRLGLAASHSRERALDGAPGENSPFAQRLLKRLRENVEELGVQKLATEIIEDVQSLTRGRQTPVFKSLDVKGDDSGQYVFHLKANEEKDWAACQDTGTLAAYQAFLVKYPAGKHFEAARQRATALEEEAAWKAASTKNTILAYYQYNEAYPKGKYQREALEAIRHIEEEQAWHLAKQHHSLAGLLEYKSSYPEGRFISEADDLIQRILSSQEEPAAWQQALARGTVEDYESYLRKFPDGGHARQAQAAISALRQKAEAAGAAQKEEEAWSIAKNADKEKAYQQYLKAYPQGKYASEASAALSLLRKKRSEAEARHRKKEQEEEQRRQQKNLKEAEIAWAKAKQSHTIAALQGYLRQYPNSPHSEEARQLLAGLQRAGTQEQRQSVRRYLPAAGGVLVAVIVIWGIAKWMGGSQKGETRIASLALKTVTLGEKNYRAVGLDGLLWMAQNLDYEVPDSWCYDNDPVNCEKYGRLYTWAAAKKACAAVGWRLPTEEEWQKMARQFGGSDSDASDGGKAAFKALVEGGESGFSAQLAGSRQTNSSFQNLNLNGYYWSASENGAEYAWGYGFNGNNRKLYRYGSGNKDIGSSCRCVQDESPGNKEPVKTVQEEEGKAWEAAKQKDDVTAYENYQRSYPSGQYYQQAQKRIDALKEQQRQAEAASREEQAWNETSSKNTIAAYQAYQAAYPQGKYYADAGKMIRELEAAAAKPSSPRIRTLGSNKSVILGGKTYRTVRLAGLTWMAQNLDYQVANSWCYDDDAANCQKYGRLYTWEAAKKACEAVGWRLPTDEEWKRLANAHGGYYDWETKKDIGNPEEAYQALLEGGNSGFSALLGGNRSASGRFLLSLGSTGGYWSATEYGTGDTSRYYFFHFDSKLTRLYGTKTVAHSCRCVKD